MADNTYTGGNDTECRRSQVRVGLPIPGDISYFVLAAPPDDAGMRACRDPHPVNLMED